MLIFAAEAECDCGNNEYVNDVFSVTHDAFLTESSSPYHAGNGWIRGMLEASTRVATASVYPEQSASFVDAIDAYSAPCGWLADCGLVRSATANPVVIKTHYPFLASALGSNAIRPQPPTGGGAAAADVNGTVVYAISPVRNPLDNFDAWRRYFEKRGNQSRDPHRDVRDFVDAWADHHTYWAGAPVPVTVYGSSHPHSLCKWVRSSYEPPLQIAISICRCT